MNSPSSHQARTRWIWLTIAFVALATAAFAASGATTTAAPQEPAQSPDQELGYRLSSTWRDMWAASRVVAGDDGFMYVLINDGQNLLQMQDGVLQRVTNTQGLHDVAVNPAGDIFAIRGLFAVRVNPAGGDVWTDRIQGEWHPRVPGNERIPFLQSVAWNKATSQFTLLYDKDDTWTRLYAPTGPIGPGFSLAFPRQAYWDLEYDDAGRAYVLNRASNSVEVYENGNVQSAHVLPATAERIALGPQGSLFFLHDRRWVVQIQLDTGEILDVWSVIDPEPGVAVSTVIDIAADAAGRVYAADAARNRVRVYERMPGHRDTTVPTPPPPGCQILVDKTADPTYLWLGDQTKVTLDLQGECLDVAETADIVLVVDRSDSMNYEGGRKIEAAKLAVKTFVDLMDLGRDQVALVTFASDTKIDVPLTHDGAALKAAADRIIAGEGTDIAGGLDTAHLALEGPERRADAKPIVIMMTDGVPFDTSRLRAVAAGDRLRHADIAMSNDLNDPRVTLYTIGLGQDVDPELLKLLARTPDRYFFAPDASALVQVYRDIAKRITASVLLKDVTIVDYVPNNMTYVLNSAVPPATWDPSLRTLTWDFTNVPFEGIEMSYWLQPQQVGEWPTNIRADYTGTDGLDQPQQGVFPIPRVVVVSATITPTPTIRPPTATPTPTQTPTNTALPPSATSTPTTVPTATVSPSPTPDRYTIYVIIAFNGTCFKRYSDVVLVVDASTTMLRPAPGGRIKLDEAKDASLAFLDQLQLAPDDKGRHDRAAIVWYNDTARLEQPLTSDRAALEAALNRIQPQQGTRINLGLREGHLELARGSNPFPGHTGWNNPVMVLLSDGIPNRTTPEEIFAEADDAKWDGITLYTVGYGEDVNEPLLKRVASQPEQYFYAPSGADLTRIYEKIAGEIVCR